MFKGVGKGHVWFSNLVNTAQYPKSTSQSECAKNYIRAKNDRLYEWQVAGQPAIQKEL